MNSAVRTYLAKIGQKGGRKSRRTLAPEAARGMVRVREARRAYRHFFARCFWSFDPNLVIGEADIPWLAGQLRKSGGHEGWAAAARLCR